MTQDEIMELAESVQLADNGLITNGDYTEELVKFFRLAYARGMLKQEEQFMQLFLDPENQPTQFGTATQEYREKEVKEVQDLLTELAHHVRTKHLYGMEVQKMLEKEAAIRARGQQ
jgi:hypothetical protein